VTTSGGVPLLRDPPRLRSRVPGVHAAALAERPAADLRGMSLIAAFGSAALDSICREATTTGAPASGEADIGRAARSFAVDAVPIAVADPDAIGPSLVVAMHDVTTLRRVERVRRDFVANISHELRTPLASIKLLAETLGAGAVDDAATARDFIAQIERETDHLSQLVNELLDLSMIESGETSLSIEPLDPEAVLDEVAARIGPVAQRRGLRVRRLPAPAEEGGVRIAGDVARIGQAVLNLAHNAVKFSHPGGEVRLGWERHGAHVRLWVADDGIGVPAAHQPRIFERFYKVDRARATERDEPTPDAGGGSAGLGLAIVRHIAEAHRGSVGMDSGEGTGSTFWIEVPIAD
jgi:two-component system phosphate regulon sensor histidine kinase PhoR